eukprot:5762839-Amphidinium_carterae.1
MDRRMATTTRKVSAWCEVRTRIVVGGKYCWKRSATSCSPGRSRTQALCVSVTAEKRTHNAVGGEKRSAVAPVKRVESAHCSF